MASRFVSFVLLPLVVVGYLAVACPDASAQGYAQRNTQGYSPSNGYYGGGFDSNGYGYRYSVPVYGNRFDGSYGGYVYDPYSSGRFIAPDLLNDPLFQAQHKFDSRFPGRYGNQHQRRSSTRSRRSFRRLRTR